MNQSITIIFLLIIPLYCFSQDTIIEGVVADANNVPLVGAMVILENKNSGNDIDYYAVTDSEGKFKILVSSKSYDTYMLTIRYLGFESVTKSLSQIENYNFQLTPANKELPEVNVKADSPPIIRNQDTVTMNVEDFIDSTDRNVEDVIKKLPGVQIDKSGLIKVKGKNIRTVLVEDSDLLGHQYTLGTKNIKATSIDKIQIIDHYQDNPLMKDVNLSEDIVLNLKLNQSVKNIVTGSVMAKTGAGEEEFKYNVSPKVFYFSRKFKLLSVSTYKNAGEGYTIREIDATTGGSLGNTLKADLLERNKYVQAVKIDNPGIQDYYISNAKNKFASVRSEYQINTNTKFQVNGYITDFSDHQSVINKQSYLYDDNYIVSNTEELSLNRFDWSVESSVFHLGPEGNTSLKGLLNLSSQSNRGNKFFAADLTSYNNDYKTINYLAAAEFIWKLKQNSLFKVESQVQGINESSFAVFTNPDYSNYFSTTLADNLIQQRVIPEAKLLATNVSYLFNERNITGSFTFDFEQRSYDLSVKYRDNENMHLTLFDKDSASLNVARNNLSASGNVRIDISNNFYVKVRPKISWNTNKVSEIAKNVSFTDHDWYIRTFTSLSKYLELSNTYRYVKHSPEPFELYSIQYISSPYIVYKEIIRQEQNLSHRLRVRLKHEDKGASRVIGLFGSYGFGRMQWTSEINFLNSIQEINPFYSDGNDYTQFRLLFDQYIFPIRIGIEIEPSWYLGRSENVIEGDQKVFYNQLYKLQAKIYTKISPSLRFEVEGLYSNRFSYLQNEFANSNKVGITTFQAKLEYYKNSWELGLVCDYFSSSRSTSDVTFISGNFMIRKNGLFSNENLSCELTINNLLNRDYFSQFYNDEMFAYESSTELIKAHFLFGVDYSF